MTPISKFLSFLLFFVVLATGANSAPITGVVVLENGRQCTIIVDTAIWSPQSGVHINGLQVNMELIAARQRDSLVKIYSFKRNKNQSVEVRFERNGELVKRLNVGAWHDSTPSEVDEMSTATPLPNPDSWSRTGTSEVDERSEPTPLPDSW